jgi:hypothetical protein
MQQWTRATASMHIHGFGDLSDDRGDSLIGYMNLHYPFPRYEEHRARRRTAIGQMDHARKMVAEAVQQFPPFIEGSSLRSDPGALRGCAVVFTAGGEGERLKTSLLKRGISEAALANFTKATFGLPGFPNDFGTLQINLSMIAVACRTTGIDIPVVVTTGPAGSTTAEVIPEILSAHDNFGLKHLVVIEQEERLFLDNDERIVLAETGGILQPIVHPDETGGPLMKLKRKGCAPSGAPVLEWLDALGCTRTIVVQGTALYDRTLLPLMASALGSHDCLGVGILRTAFPATDPYGTYVSLNTSGNTVTMILEQDVRNETTRRITDQSGRYFLPFNTGLYAFRNQLLLDNDLPDFATPPKELRPDLPRAPKIGYAAIDIITLARDPIILTIGGSLFGVLKNADDLDTLAQLGKKFGLDQYCRAVR